MEKLTFTYFTIEEFGLFTNTGEFQKQFYVDTSVIFDELLSWIAGKNIDQTKVMERDPSKDYYPLYCHNIIKVTRDSYLVTMWNETASFKGAVASLPKLGTVGKARASKTKLPDGAIPGYPSYFYVLPKEGKVINIKREDGLSSSVEFSHYIKRFVQGFSRYVVRDSKDIDYFNRNVLGHSIDGEEIIDNLTSKFRIKQMYKKSKVLDIKKRYKKIYKLVKTNKLDISVAKNESSIASVLSSIGVSSKKLATKEVRFKTEIDYKPSKEEVGKIITKWQKEFSKNPDVRVGFRLEGNSKEVFWLNGMLVKDKIKESFKDDLLIVSTELVSILKKAKIKKMIQASLD